MTDSFNLVDATEDSQRLFAVVMTTYHTLLESGGKTNTIRTIAQHVGSTLEMLRGATSPVQFKGFLDTLNQTLAPLEGALNTEVPINTNTAQTAGQLIVDARDLYNSLETSSTTIG